MNTNLCTKIFFLFLSFSFGFALDSYANSVDNTIVDTEVEQRILSMSSSIDMRYTEEVKKRIKQYTVSQRSASEVLLGRISIYFPLIESKLRERGMPDDLKYLAVIESGLIPHAKSRVGAAGLWQFMKPTARMYGMKITKTIDQRRDPEISTDAALDYLQYLYEKYDDWALAMGAYNCGPGNMNKAIRKANSKDFYKVSKFLSKETRAYVPKFIAMSYLMNYYYSHDLIPNLPDNRVLNTTTSKVLGKVKFSDISIKHNVELETIQLLNPTYIRDYIPGGTGHKLTLPTDVMINYLSSIETNESLILYNHVNGMKRKTSLTRGNIEIQNVPVMNILLDRSSAPKLPNKTIAKNLNGSAYRSTAKKHLYYTLRSKESLSDVAKKHDMDIAKLMEINNYTANNLPSIGETIKVVAEM